MALFHYKARGLRGDLLEGQLDAASADAAAAQLLNTGVTPVDIREQTVHTDVFAALNTRLTARDPDLGDLILFSRQMYTLMKAGVPLIRGLRRLSESSRNPRMVEILDDIRENLESGQELGNSLARYDDVFGSLFISLVRVGENTGRLDEAFLRITEYLELERETRDAIKAALRYPIFVIIAISIAMGIINVFVIPAFAKVFEQFHAELPWATQLLMSVSAFFVSYWPHMLGLLVLAFIGIRAWVRTEEGRYRWDKWKLRIPVVGGILERATLGRFARAFSITARSGVPLIQALAVVARAVDNEFVGDRILEMRNGIERGDSLSRTAAATGMFTPLVLQMIAVGEETGAVDDMLEEVAGFYEREVSYDIKNLSAAIEPILLVAVGGMVLILALGVFLPMWDLGSAATQR